MTKYAEEEDLLKDVLRTIKNKAYKGKLDWKNGNTLVFTNKGKEEGKISFKYNDIEITGKVINNIYKKYKKIYLNAVKNKVKTTDVSKTPLKDMFNSINEFGSLELNPVVVKLMNAEFKKFGIVKVKMEGELNQNDTISTNLTLAISTSTNNCGTQINNGWEKRLKTFLFDEMDTDKKDKEEIIIKTVNKFNNFEEETSIEMSYKRMILGYYYPERNFIHLIYNPFTLKTQSVFDNTISNNWVIIFNMFKSFKVKNVDVSKIQEKLFISEFMKNSRKTITDTESNLKQVKKNIEANEKNIRDYIMIYQTGLDELAFLNELIKSKGKGLYTELDKTKKLPFVEQVKIEGSTIDIKFKPTFMPIPIMRRHDGGKAYGKRYIWIGSIGFKISPSSFRVYGDVKIKNFSDHCHPHGNDFPEGSACFGNGDGRNKIYSLLAQNKFCDLTKMLRFWTKTYKNSGAYVKVWDAYDSILCQGYPVLDEKRKIIEINDKVRIGTGEQVTLSKLPNYEENKKKFGKVKLEV